MRMNTITFLCSKVRVDRQNILDGVYNVLNAMRVTYWKKLELASYQLREVSQVWYNQWKDNRLVESCRIRVGRI